MSLVLDASLDASEEGLHNCTPLLEENILRVGSGDNAVFIFRDLFNDSWYMRVGLEFVRMNVCPFCEERL